MNTMKRLEIYKITKENLFSIILIIFIFCNNPFFELLPVKFIYLYITFFFFLFIIGLKLRLNHYISIFILIHFISTIATCRFNSSIVPFQYTFLSSISFIVFYSLSKSEIFFISNFSYKLFKFSLIGGVLAIVSYFLFPIDLLQLKNLSFFPFSLLYLTSTIPRVAGFFHEPGQLSFYICYFSAILYNLNYSKRKIYFILILGLVTQSTAHIFFLIFFIIHDFRKYNLFKIKYILSILLVILILYLTGFLDSQIERYNIIIDDPRNFGRINSFFFAQELLGSDFINYLYGPDKLLSARIVTEDHLFIKENFNDRFGVPLYGENILTPLVWGGFLSSWPYYFLLLYAIYRLFFHKDFLFFSTVFLLIQRPYFLEFPYTFIVALYLKSRFFNK